MTTLYTSPYANNLGKMENSEITGLAKNRFTDEETMLAISKHHYRLGKEYLASNPNLTQEAAEELWDHRLDVRAVANPTVKDGHIFVPLVNGDLVALRGL